MKTVTFYMLDSAARQEEVGTLSWDGKEWHTGGEKKRMQRVLGQSIIAPVAGKIQRISSKDNPEEFLEGLHLQYRNPYFCATQAVEKE